MYITSAVLLIGSPASEVPVLRGGIFCYLSGFIKSHHFVGKWCSNGVPDEWQDSRIVGQRELQSPVVGGRDIRLDILAKDSTGKQYNVEVQQKPEGHISDGPDSIAA